MYQKEGRNWKVYRLQSPEGVKYFGKTCDKLNDRWANGKGYTKNERLNNDIEKFGWENFEKILIEEGLEYKDAADMEVQLIAENGGVNSDKIYNIETGGDAGYTISEESRQKRKKVFNAPEMKKKMSEAKNKNYRENPELKVKISKASKRMYEEHPEYKQATSERFKRWFIDHPEAREAQRQKMLNMPEEQKKAHSEFMKKRYVDNPELSIEFGKRMKALYDDPEYRSKMAKILRDKAAVPVKRYDINGIFIKEYETVTDAASDANVTVGAICSAMYGRSDIVAGSFWRPAEGKINPIFNIPHNGKYVYQIDPNTKQIIAKYESCRDAARSLNLNEVNASKNIAYAAKYSKISHGFYWQYVDDYNQKMEGPSNEEIIF